MPKQPETTVTAVSDVAGERIRELRRRRSQSVDQLAQAAAEAGHPELTRDAIYAIESGRRLEGRRRRTISIDELLAFAEVLGVPARELLPVIRTGTPLDFAGLSDKQRMSLEAEAARAAPAIAREIMRRLTEGPGSEPRAVAEASYRLQEALNALLIGEA